ncbi:MAG: OmpA family protein [Bacteroidia bacterium]|nr:OmpA family protein [Bacteroidia bacterium]
MKSFTLISFLLSCLAVSSQVKTITWDKNWTSREEVVINSPEADFIIRIGDVDNLGFGWPEDFDPFCGRMTQAHAFPWEADPGEMNGFDRILLSSKFKPGTISKCGGDGYTDNYNPLTSKPVEWKIQAEVMKKAAIRNAFIQLFIDDFQSPSFCSKFQFLLNGKRFVEGEKFLNAVDQSGPVGKLISIPLPEEFWPMINEGSLTIKIDEITGAHDGFAVDFIRLVLNRKRENACKGSIAGTVLDKVTQEPIRNARVYLADKTEIVTDSEGKFQFRDVPAGFEIIGAQAEGYLEGYAQADINEGDDNPPVTLYLEKGKNSIQFGGKTLRAGESVQLNLILFDQGKSELKPEAKAELEKIVAFLKANPTAEIELSGHTSAEGDAQMNRSLSYQRVNACKKYVVSKGIDEGRIISVGFGPDKPVAPNDTEPNRAKNRRVEMRVLKI